MHFWAFGIWPLGKERRQVILQNLQKFQNPHLMHSQAQIKTIMETKEMPNRNSVDNLHNSLSNPQAGRPFGTIGLPDSFFNLHKICFEVSRRKMGIEEFDEASWKSPTFSNLQPHSGLDTMAKSMEVPIESASWLIVTLIPWMSEGYEPISIIVCTMSVPLQTLPPPPCLWRIRCKANA